MDVERLRKEYYDVVLCAHQITHIPVRFILDAKGNSDSMETSKMIVEARMPWNRNGGYCFVGIPLGPANVFGIKMDRASKSQETEFPKHTYIIGCDGSLRFHDVSNFSKTMRSSLTLHRNENHVTSHFPSISIQLEKRALQMAYSRERSSSS